LRPVDDKAEQRATASRQTAGCELKRLRPEPVLFRIARIAPPNGHFSGFFRALGYRLGMIPRGESEDLRFAKSFRTSRLKAARGAGSHSSAPPQSSMRWQRPIIAELMAAHPDP